MRAAQTLSLSKATVTKHVARLEASIGARLLHRTTKHVALTEVGGRVLGAADDLLARYESMESEVRDAVKLPRGSVRLGTPPYFGAHHLTRVIAQFSSRYPDIEVVMVMDDGRMDLVAEALDLSVRIGPTMHDASYVAQPLMKTPQVLVASPAYLRNHGAPHSVRDLARHSCLVHTGKAPTSIWHFDGNPPAQVRVRGVIRSNLGEVLKSAALLGVGISMHPTYMVSTEIREGSLKLVLSDSVPEGLDTSVVFSTRRNMPARVRHLLEFLKGWAKRPQEWIEPHTDVARRGAALR